MTSLKVKLHDFFYEHIKISDQAQKREVFHEICFSELMHLQ